MKIFYIKIVLLAKLIILTSSYSQLPIALNHPSQIIIKRSMNFGFETKNEILKTDKEKDIFLKDFANACDEMMKNPACDTDDDYRAIAEQVKMFR